MCECENTTHWHPTSWKDVLNMPVAKTIEQLDDEKKLVIETALPLEEFKKRLDGLRFQLIENWCLCKFCQLYDPENNNFWHWLGELHACLKNLRDFEIKGKINKRKTIVKMLVDDYDYNQSRKILEIIRDKFDAENMVDASKRKNVAESFVSSLDELIGILSGTETSIGCYIQTSFGFHNKRHFSAQTMRPGN